MPTQDASALQTRPCFAYLLIVLSVFRTQARSALCNRSDASRGRGPLPPPAAIILDGAVAQGAALRYCIGRLKYGLRVLLLSVAMVNSPLPEIALFSLAEDSLSCFVLLSCTVLCSRAASHLYLLRNPCCLHMWRLSCQREPLASCLRCERGIIDDGLSTLLQVEVLKQFPGPCKPLAHSGLIEIE